MKPAGCHLPESQQVHEHLQPLVESSAIFQSSSLVPDRLERSSWRPVAGLSRAIGASWSVSIYLCAGTSKRVEYFGPEGERMLCLSLTLSTLKVPKLSSVRCPRNAAISSRFRPDLTRATVMWGLNGRVSRLKPS